MAFYPPGTRIGQYEIAGRPMLGGMGIVYVCLDLEEDRPVALKTFKPEYLPDRAARDRFLREGTHWVDLGAHPHIVRCYNVLYSDPEVYLVLELVAKEQGRDDASLRAWLTPGMPLPLGQALLFALQIARGMQHAVDTVPGFVHRDLKPENVLVGADRLPGADLSGSAINRLRVTDFGLAAALEVAGRQQPAAARREWAREGESSGTAGSLGRTQLTRGVVGTPLYMAPEQWRGERVSIATDVYALGCILYEMVAGQRAVMGHSLAALRRAHCEGQRRPLLGGVPAEVGEVVARCLAVEPGERYGSWDAFGVALGTAYRAMAGLSAPTPVRAAALSHEERVAVGWSYNEMGWSYRDLGKAEVALSYFQRALAAGRAEGEQRLEAAGLTHLGSAYLLLGDARRAVGYFEGALAIFRELGDRQGEGAALGNLGLAYARLGDAPRAVGHYEQHLEIAHSIGARRGEGAALGNLGEAYRLLGDARRAIGHLEQALALDRELGDRRGEGNTLGNLGNAYLQLGDAQRSIGYYEQQLAVTREIGDRRGEGVALGSLGNTCLQLDDARRAIGFFELQLVISREIGAREHEGSALGSLGSAYLLLGDARRAIGFYKQQLVITREIGDRLGEGNALGNLGNAHFDLDEIRHAISYYEQSLEVKREVGNVAGIASTSFNLALLHTQQGERGRALPLAQQAADIWGRIGSPHAQRAQQLVAQLRAALR
jgi:tetratricopeptide (TPR) repeat protein